jgi:tellurite resistance-related uncharacterized protein
MNTNNDGDKIPDGFELTRTTDVFDNETAPAGLLRAHRVAAGVWGRLVVHSGTVGFVFEDEPDQLLSVGAGANVAIPPARPHHVVLDGPATFAVEFYRQPNDTGADLESSGLAAPTRETIIPDH